MDREGHQLRVIDGAGAHQFSEHPIEIARRYLIAAADLEEKPLADGLRRGLCV